MVGQSHIEHQLDARLRILNASAKRSTVAIDLETSNESCLINLSNGEVIKSRYVIGADGAQSFVRKHFKVPFEVTRPGISWAVIDGVIESDFPKVPEIIVFQTDTADVAWIPREDGIDRFYVRMDSKDYPLEEAIAKINRAMPPHSLKFKSIIWSSHFSVKESVAETFRPHERVFLAGDACHIHSVNGGQGLNTGLADAFNLLWKINMVLNYGAPEKLLQSYEKERKPIAHQVIETSGTLVRSTKHSSHRSHAQDYVKHIKDRSGNITGMGIRYRDKGLEGSRIHDFYINDSSSKIRLYTLLDYTKFTLLVFADKKIEIKTPSYIVTVQIYTREKKQRFWSDKTPYPNQAVLVRPDSYIESFISLNRIDSYFRASSLTD